MFGFSAQQIGSSKKRKKGKSQLAHTERRTVSLTKDRPALARRTGIMAFGLIIFIILIWQVTQILAPADIEILSPRADLMVQDQQLVIRGSIEPGSILTLNGEPLVADPEGGFSEEIHLQKGLNTLIFEVKKRYGKIRQVIRYVYVEESPDD